MIVIEKSVLTTAATVAGVAFVGLVAYKILKKKKPDLLKKAKASVSNVKKKASKMVTNAKKSFREGYAQA